MSVKKYGRTWKIILTVICTVFLGCLFSFLTINERSAFAAKGSSASVGAIYDFEKSCYNEDNLNSLAQKILGDNSKNFKDLINAADSAGNMGTPIDNKQLTISFGRYRASKASNYKNMLWIPVYLSKSKKGDPILTLYLAESATSTSGTSSQELSKFSYSSTYSTVPDITAPTNSYGTSYIRAGVLAGGSDRASEDRQYTYYSNDHTKIQQMLKAQTPTADTVFKFSDFIKMVDGTEGAFYDDIVTPSEILWQEKESAVDYLDKSSAYSKNCWPNDAYGTPASGSYFQPNYFDYAKNDKINYNVWQYDKLWLPSLTEVGTGNIDGNGQGIKDGIWQLTNYQRNNNIASWLRTAYTQAAKTGSGSSAYSAYTMFATAADGTITTLDASATPNYGVRPAIHLNLRSLSEKTVAPVKLPDVITATYTGLPHIVSAQGSTIDAEQLKGWWRDDGSMNVGFSSDEGGNVGLSPISSGKYYMIVTLLDQHINFYGEPSSTRWKAVEFIVEKIKLKVTWTHDTYNNNTPTSVTYDPAQILEVDKLAGNVPKLGMMYSNVLGVGLQKSKEFPDEKGTYTAEAYILDSDIYNYNYEVADSSKTSQEFTVKEKNIDLPYFAELGGTDTPRELIVQYKGKQYIQIANISNYIEITVTAKGTDEKITAVANEKLQDLGVKNGIHTFIVETVAEYTFTAKLVDTINTQWSTSTSSNKDVSEKKLLLNVKYAPITVSFDGLPSSWDTNTEMSFNLSILGIYDDATVSMNVYYITSSGQTMPVSKSPTTGKYVIPKGLKPNNNYRLVAAMNNQTQSNYYMQAAKTQKFAIVQATASFGSAKANWVYVVGNSVSTNSAGGYADHDTPDKAIEVENTEEFYKFSLSWSETRLTAENLRATYTGDTYVKDAGLYSVTVTVSGYNKNVLFNDEVYTIYFRIKKKLFDLSAVKWNYSGKAFTYSGNEHSVNIDPGTLPQGLTVAYTTDGNSTDAGEYKTFARFIVSDNNYEVPTVTDSTSYKGADFSFSCDWEIVAQEILVNWNTDNPLFVPTLRVGHGYVDYSYEHKVGDSWIPCTELTAETVAETYRVSAAVKQEFARNYVLVDNKSQEFLVESGKRPVTIGFTINDAVADNDEQFVYTGKPFEVKPVVDTFGVSISSYKVEYYVLTAAGAKGENLGSSAPKNVGKYAAVVAVTFEGGYLDEGSNTEIHFEVIKADMDLTGLRWAYEYTTSIGTTIINNKISAYWDVIQNKWIDDNGKEVVFEFEYDGTEKRVILEGENTVPELMISGISGNTGTTARTYSVSVEYTWSENYNEPAFPKTLSWVINKASVDLSNVRWGYIEADGTEHDFDFETKTFQYKRAANIDGSGSHEVPYTVGLINLPSYISSYFSYKTTNLTKVNAKEEDGNSFADIGSYTTRFVFSGEYSDSNHNMFNASSIPSTLSTYVHWEISERELTKPVYLGGWSKYDNKVYDLISLCNMPDEELPYYNIDITFVDSLNNITKHYDGTNYIFGDTKFDFGGKYFAKNAGTYIVDFYQIREVESEDADIFWGRAEVVVKTEELIVTWDENGSYPIADVKGVAVTDMIGTKYTSASGNEVPLSTILSVDDVTFFAIPYIKPAYAQNLSIKMADGQPEKKEFKSVLLEFTEASQKLEYPEFVKDSLEFTGEKLTFSISAWYQMYEAYLYISDGDNYDSDKGEVYATEVGEYYIVLNFKKGADAYWANTEGNRSSRVLQYKVTKPTKMAVEFPELNSYSEEFTGSAINFSINNWLVLNEYLDYEVFYKGVSQGTNLSQTAAGIYTIKFNFKTDSIGYWRQDPDNPKREYQRQFEIVDPNADLKELASPEFTTDDTTVVATGRDITFTVKNWSRYVDYVDISSLSDRVTISVENGTVSASAVGSYTIVFTIKAGYDIKFSDGGTTCMLTFRITPNESIPSEIDKPSFGTDTMPYTGNEVQFKIDNWDSIYKSVLEIVSYSDGVTVSEDGVISVKQKGDYEIVVAFKANSNAFWTGGGTEPYTLKFHVSDASSTDKIYLDKPTLTFNEKEFTGNGITFVISDWNNIKNYVTIIEGENYLTQTEVGDYVLTLKIDPAKAFWKDSDGSVSASNITLPFSIKKATISVEVGADGKVIAKNGDGEVMSIDDYFEYVYTYTDEDGNEITVSADELEEGKMYTVNVAVKADKQAEFEKNVANASEIKTQLAGNTYIFTYEKPSRGLDTKLIIIIASVAAVLLLFIVFIIIMAKRRSRYYDDYDDYDDYDEYDDYDDYDEYDDDYDEGY